ncbi:glycerol-3-phosphate dehydrogenase/oxidase [Saccharospirillum salsuginis]|uniref:FAD-dependent glycerol-3-phosphate dehydrogenase n=1 Tax=Saccharospirillum salsuginis TaxID=418750 RepID=A0A918K1Q6_9GAMM|nr:glycerol-3-phosphate dehydrogenase/oxidase [Saccharospirillum salsuginis]GGX40274.1 FAD-dependent glycerol-3-phosphate dehydrogenase [Saccharospirillum salsuginis]
MSRHGASAWSRRTILEKLRQGDGHYDLVIIGGGITGAGILREAARIGLRVLLVEQRDFAWGASSRSSKMVHGGLRYLGSGHVGLTRDAVRERQRLLDEAPGLVEPLPFVWPHYRKQFPWPRIFGALLTVYDWMAGRRNHEYLKGERVLDWVPGLNRAGLYGGTRFGDAVTDDARLVLRVLHEGVEDGGDVLNYVRAERVIREEGRVTGLDIWDVAGDSRVSIKTDLVINATGAWTDELRAQCGASRTLRPLRGSHLVFPFWRLPVACTVSLFHPDDGRPVFVFPWEGVTVVGTTDLDHQADPQDEARIMPQEVDYLLAIVDRVFPYSGVGRSDVLACWAGVRPVVGGHSRDPSRENREHAIWDDGGLISVAGGKLTTFRPIALEVLEQSLPYLDTDVSAPTGGPVFDPVPPTSHRPKGISARQWRRLQGHYGGRLSEVLAAGPLEPVASTGTLWAELVWSARNENVEHLDDLLLRRTRLGLILPRGAEAILDRVQALCEPVLDWSSRRWGEERRRYLDLWRRAYSLPQAGDRT